MKLLPLVLLLPTLAACMPLTGHRYGAGHGYSTDSGNPVTILRDHFDAGETASLQLRNPLGEEGWRTAPHERSSGV